VNHVDHNVGPKQKFIFYVAQDVDQSIRDDVTKIIGLLADAREWSIAPPEFIDEVDEDGSTSIIGGAIDVYSALPPNVVSYAADLLNLQEVEALIRAVKNLSKKRDIDFDFQLGSEYVGSIESGVIDQVLECGLILPWREALQRKV
jgi:hypothetical protein